MHKNRLGSIYFITFLLLISPLLARADGWEILPDNRHQLFETYGLFFDEQCTFVNYEQARLWGALGGTIPIYGNNDLDSHPQFTFHASANAAMHYDSNFRFYTETVDARFGADFQYEFTPDLRASIGVTHNSGHAADGMAASDVQNPDGSLGGLFTATLGQEYVPIRLVYDFGELFPSHERHTSRGSRETKYFRVGAEIFPFLRSYPSMEPVGFDEFAEWFPWGALDDAHHGTWFLAAGLSQWGTSYFNTFNAQAGVYFGNHMSPVFHEAMRLIVGYYTGADPRLKYFEFENDTMTFFYFGAMFNI